MWLSRKGESEGRQQKAHSQEATCLFSSGRRTYYSWVTQHYLLSNKQQVSLLHSAPCFLLCQPDTEDNHLLLLPTGLTLWVERYESHWQHISMKVKEGISMIPYTKTSFFYFLSFWKLEKLRLLKGVKNACAILHLIPSISVVVFNVWSFSCPTWGPCYVHCSN